MSMEAMSPGPSVATAPAISSPSVSSFSGEFAGSSPSLGGTQMPGFDSLAYQDTFQMPSPSLNSLEGGRSISNISPFENTQTLWQAPSISPDSPKGGKTIAGVSAFENTQTLWQSPSVIEGASSVSVPEAVESKIFESVLEPEIILPKAKEGIIAVSKSEQVLNLQNVRINEPVQDSKAETNQVIMQPEVTRNIAISKVREALKVEEALLLVKDPEKEMEKLAVKTEEKTAIKTQQTVEKGEVKEEKDNKINRQPAKLYFEHDTNADETRKTAGLGAIEKVSEKIADEKIVEATGQDIAEQMPNPQPKEVKSEIAKDKDGSYESLVGQLETTGTIYSASEAKSLIEKLVNENHAVRINRVLSSQEASENEVKKVLGGGQDALADPLTSP